jgi:Cytochrome C oxidase, cbb3-type, subunit III
MKQLRFLVLMSAVCLFLSACDKGDYLGPVERSARALFNGWDMWSGKNVRPYEPPMLQHENGTVPISGVLTFDHAQTQIAAMVPADRKIRERLVYRRYCHHCHGPGGDGRIIVGESFDVKIPDLRSDAIQSKTDREIYTFLQAGSKNMISLTPTMSPADSLLAISHIKRLGSAPSSPYYSPLFDTPVE